MKNAPLFLTVRDRTGLRFEGNCLAITSYNQKGKFDVLKEHANFISLIQNSITIVKPDGSQTSLSLSNGVMRVVGNTIDILIGVKK